MHKYFFKNYYFINKFNKNNIDKLDNNTGIIYRNYKKKLNLIEIIKIRDYCKTKGLKIFLANNIKIALKFRLNGAYLPSFNKDLRHLNYKFKNSFVLLGSAHNIKEIRCKEVQNVNVIFISSVFKKNKNYLGIYKFKKLRNLTQRKVIALGGISRINKKKIRLLDCHGFSGISYFE